MSDRMTVETPGRLALGLDGFVYADLFSPHGLKRLHDRWRLSLGDPALAARYDAYRAGEPLDELTLSALLVDLAGTVSRFVEQLFPDTAELRRQQQAETTADLELFRFKEEVVKRRASKRSIPPERAESVIAQGDALLKRHGLSEHHSERQLAELGLRLLDAETAAWRASTATDEPALREAREELSILLDWLVARRPDLERAGFLSWRLPHPTDYQNLVPLRRVHPALPEQITGAPEHQRRRDGFALTDPRKPRLEVLAEVDYCLYCHERNKDSCSKGFHDKSGAVKQNPLGAPLTGCPLGEKISEMHTLRRRGDSLGALVLVTIDNPMCAGTGHRICNDCMKSCIFQKQDPVNIPEIETSVLTDVLALPWGVEIYGLLTRWNPLHPTRPYPLPYTGKNVLVVGLGPAGYTLGHHLTREGFGVIAVDGLKLEPLPHTLTGDWPAGVLPEPIRDFESLKAPLDERVLTGFGGVSEYGITVRWDKNFLQLLYVTLAQAAAAPDVWRGAVWRNADAGRCVAAWRSSRRDCHRSGQAHAGRSGRQPVSGHPPGERLFDGAPAYRRVQAGLAGELAGATPGAGDWRRTDRDRHRDRAARLLHRAGRKDAGAVGSAARRGGTSATPRGAALGTIRSRGAADSR